jgi:hypothetical protein
VKTRIVLIVVAVTLAVAAAGAAPAQAQVGASCDAFTTPAELRGEVPTPRSVLGIDLGERDVTTAESDAYLEAVDRASTRVFTGTAATSVQGRPLRYAVVGRAARLTDGGLRNVRAAVAALQDPATPRAEALRVARRAPAILWVAGNVHGGEESGTDAALRVLYELAERRDCAARAILDEAVVVILPTQNPDGREADTRRNAYGFDMNRDWFARTQPETDGKVELVRRLPPVLFIDAHEMGDTRGYFFPPNADPIYHEISRQSVNWINNVYGAAMQREFTRQRIPFFNYDLYDLFYMGFGDTVPSTAFNAAGMTFEKTSSHPTPRRVYEQYVAIWTSLSEAARDKDRILRDHHQAWVEAERQGDAGVLEPNEVVQPENTVQRPVPETRIRHYFVRDDDPAKRREVQELVRRLQRFDVEVRRLTAPLRIGDFREYGRPARAATLPAGTYWIPMGQRQKHWVQAMMNEDTYVPFPYFYDITAWSQPLLFNVAGGFSGQRLTPTSARVGELADPGEGELPADAPSVAVFQLSATSTASIESSGWLRWLLDRWGLERRDVAAADVAGGGLAGTDVLLIPSGGADAAYDALGEAGRAALVEWVRAGGRLVAWRGGAALAARLGVTLAQLTPATSQVPGSLVRTRVAPESPLAAGVGPFTWSLYVSDFVMRHVDPVRVAARFPETGSEDFFVSGYAEGAEELGGTAAVVDEPFGAGRSVLFAFDPNFRGFTDGTQKLLRNAILGPAPATGTAARRSAPSARAAAVARAQAAAGRLPDAPSALRLVVPAGEEAEARAVLARFGAAATTVRGGGRVAFVIANPGELSADEHPYARRLAGALRESDVRVLGFSAP